MVSWKGWTCLGAFIGKDMLSEMQGFPKFWVSGNYEPKVRIEDGVHE